MHTFRDEHPTDNFASDCFKSTESSIELSDMLMFVSNLDLSIRFSLVLNSASSDGS